MPRSGIKLPRKEVRQRSRNRDCPMCNKHRSFLWSCKCGFVMCDICMQKELWGFTCNNITWTCPDCGAQRSY